MSIRARSAVAARRQGVEREVTPTQPLLLVPASKYDSKPEQVTLRTFGGPLDSHGSLASMALIYTSSTIRDLRGERLLVQEAVLRLGHHPIGMEHYGADRRRPLDKCVQDVRQCDALVQLVAWRRGFMPGETPGRSIVESEYRAARELGIPTLVYLLHEEADWPEERRDPELGPVLEYRELLERQHTVAHFRSSRDLQLQVTADLARQLGAVDPVPAVLPFLCNRAAQVRTLRRRLESRPAEVPLVCLIRGPEGQGLEGFVTSLLSVHLPRFLGLGETAIPEVSPQWVPRLGADEAIEHLGYELASELGQTTADPEALARGIQSHGPALAITLPLPTDRWTRADGVALGEVVRFFLERVRVPPPSHLFLLLLAKERRSRGLLWPLGAMRRRMALRDTLSGLRGEFGDSPGFVALPALESVPRSDVEHWLRRREVRGFLTRESALDAQIESMFERRPALPMEALALQLEFLLARRGKPLWST